MINDKRRRLVMKTNDGNSKRGRLSTGIAKGIEDG